MRSALAGQACQPSTHLPTNSIMIYKIRYAVALLEKLCDHLNIDYHQEKKYWHLESQKAAERFEAETAERAERYKAEAAERAKKHEAIKARINQGFNNPN